jgi:hypothetical protein
VNDHGKQRVIDLENAVVFDETQLLELIHDQLVAMLRSGGTSTLEIDRSAGQHGHDLLLKGFTVSQVVHDYGDVCQTVTDLALETNAPISTEDFRTLNRCLDEAIASAVTMYERDSQQSHADKATDRDNERMGFIVHALRNLVGTAVLAFEVLRSGNVGVGWSTGAVLNRSLTGLRDLIARSLDEVRLTNAVRIRKRILVAEFVEEIGLAPFWRQTPAASSSLYLPYRRSWRLKPIDQSSRPWSRISCRTRSSSPDRTVP